MYQTILLKRPKRRSASRSRLALIALGLLLFATGCEFDVTLTDDDADSVLFELSEMVPGSTDTKCIEITYTGTTYHLTPVSLYATSHTSDEDLAEHLDVTIEMGTGANFGSCADFTSEATVLTTTPLSTLVAEHSNFGNGISTFTPVSGNEQRAFRLTVELGADTPDSAQWSTASATFTWEIHTR